MENTWDDAWRAALDELELTVERAEELLRASDLVLLPDWEPPELPVRMPADQVERARVLLQRQLDTARKISMTAAATRQQLALADKLTSAGREKTPVYLDVTA